MADPVTARYLLTRVGQALLVLACVAVTTFALGRVLPGDLATAVLGQSATPEQIAEFHHKTGADRPAVEQFWSWFTGVLHGDFGTSALTGQRVSDALADRAAPSLLLVLLAEAFALAVAVPLAVWAAYRQGRAADKAANGASFLLLATPQFAVAVLLIYVFAVRLGTLPATGYVPLDEDPAQTFRTLLLPAVTLALGLAAVYYRVLRAGVLDTLRQDYVLAARAQGLTPRQVLVSHTLRPSLLPLVTLVGLNFGFLIGGAVIVEQLFALPGLGTYALGAVQTRDFAVLQGTVLLIAGVYVLVNLAVDLLYGVLDPRIRHAR
ncbi:ABC transporter permease [Yinghuangia seranimata]|uniref:ABC transporter permease n=1 Tax=Yinghuangia seranimata TaxID=408067 RepID=UPI00248CEB0C|nr:ABC transporter permease [Yinghuangia seranimata]MDI2124736.1 ABC transporter permease [Yinghuangia seranimata]